MFQNSFNRPKAYRLLPLTLLLAMASSCILTVMAATPGVAPVLPRVRTLENRFFFHNYEQDPIEKRLQRLELLVFGQTKSGDEQQRLQRLNVTIAERDRESAQKMQRQHQDAGSPTPTSPESSPGAGGGGAQQPRTAAGNTQRYPAVTALEWRVLKKSYPSEALDDRLGRLETKLFGQPSPTLSYADRVERLNRTLGIGAVATSPSGSRLRGPLPKTTPQTEEQLPYFGNSNGFGFFGSSDPNQKQVSELFKQMNKQMEQMMRMTPGALPGIDEYPMQPMLPVQPVPLKKKPTPYNDPNSI
jgi:hypothetical protein